MKTDGNSMLTGLKELYIFSNDPTAPVNQFREGINSEYVQLSTHLNPEISAAPSYSGTPETNQGVSEIDRFKRDLSYDYKFVHVYKFEGIKHPSRKNETSVYRYSHKELNQKGREMV